MISTGETEATVRLDRILSFLEADPDNIALLSDAAETAFSLGRLPLACELLDRQADIAPLSAPLLNLRGLIALAGNDFEGAASFFGALRDSGFDQVELRFNQAWAFAMLNRYEEAAALLDDAVVATSPRGPALKVQMLHHLGDLDAALEAGEVLTAHYPSDEILAGVLANVAMDAERPDLARLYAEQAPSQANALAVLGMFALEANQSSTALSLFDRAIDLQQDNPRSWIGKGLTLLNGGNAASAAVAIDRGATLFDTHSGSWIASGWAHFLAGQRTEARRSFERAVDLDPSFSEGHGGLAVIDAGGGDHAEAERRAAIALRLDQHSPGGNLARILLLNAKGDTEKANAILNAALNAPTGADGTSLLQMLTRRSLRSSPSAVEKTKLQ